MNDSYCGRRRCLSLQRPTTEPQRCHITYTNQLHCVLKDLADLTLMLNSYCIQSVRQTWMIINICKVKSAKWICLCGWRFRRDRAFNSLYITNAVTLFLKTHFKHGPLAIQHTWAGPTFTQSPKEKHTKMCDSVCAAILRSSLRSTTE